MCADMSALCCHYLNHAADIDNSYFVWLPLFVILKKIYGRNVMNKYWIYFLLCVIISYLIDYMCIFS